MKVKIVEKDYTTEQIDLIKLYKKHMRSMMPEMPIIFKVPDVPGNMKKCISKLPCKTIGKSRGYMHLSMKPDDFLKLLIKSGIEVQEVAG